MYVFRYSICLLASVALGSHPSFGTIQGNAAFLALLDAGIAMRATVLNVSVGVRFGNVAQLDLGAALMRAPQSKR